MKNRFFVPAIIGGVLALFGSLAHAQDPRTKAMGGAGIAAAYGNAAITTNPAQLMSRQYTFDLSLGFGAEVENFDSTKDTVKNLMDISDDLKCLTGESGGCSPVSINQSYMFENFKSDVTNATDASTVVTNNTTLIGNTVYLAPSVSINNGDKLSTTLSKLKQELEKNNADPVLSAQVDLSTGAAYGCLGCLRAYAVFANASVQTGVTPSFAASDINLIDSGVSFFNGNEITIEKILELEKSGLLSTGTQTIDLTSSDNAQVKNALENKYGAGVTSLVVVNDINSKNPTLQSQVSAVVATKGEVGFSVAQEIELDPEGIHRVHLGVSPKVVDLRIAERTVNANRTDSEKLDFTEKRAFTVDVGSSYQLPESNWNFGAVIRNIIPAQVSSASATAQISPELSIGSAYTYKNMVFASDLDLTKQSLIKNGNRDKQFLSLGGEIAVGKWLALRAGIQNNLASGSEIGTRYTAGFGLFSNAIQVSAYQGNDELGADLEFSVQF